MSSYPYEVHLHQDHQAPARHVNSYTRCKIKEEEEEEAEH